MQIRVGYELIYECVQPTPMLLMLNVHYSRVSELVAPDHVKTYPSVPISGYRDGFGNWCTRLVAPMGQIKITGDAVINDQGEPDRSVPDAQQHAVQDLPYEVLVYLLGSRMLRNRSSLRNRVAPFRSHPSVGRVCRRSAISCIIISSSIIWRPGTPARRGRCFMKRRAFAVTSRIWPWRCAGA